MLHILLLILKIIGIILAVILGILVLLICIVIFAPVRYEINGRCSGKLSTLKMKGKVTWLCSLVRADIYFKEHKLKWRLRIAWKKIQSGHGYAPDTHNKRTEGEGFEENEENEQMDEEIWKNGFAEEEEDQEIPESDEKAWYQPGEDEKDCEDSEEELSEDEKIYQEILKEEGSGNKEGAWERGEACEDRDSEDIGGIKGIVQKIKEFYSRIKCTIQNICAKIKTLLEKKDRLLGFIRDEFHVAAFQKVKKEAFKLLRRLRPEKLSLEARFGFEDPAWTGRVLAAIAPFYPLFGEFVLLRPDFTEKILAGELYAKGHIRFWTFAALAWNLFWSKHVRRTYKDIKNFKI